MVTQRQFGGAPIPGEEGAVNEKVLLIRRVAKVVKGGRHLSFNALVVVGDGRGGVGIGLGKATAVPDAVRKGNSIAKKNMIRILRKGTTVPHAISAKCDASLVLIKPAPPGTGIIAGGAVRAVMELAGVSDVVAKTFGSRNPINIVKATLQALQEIKDPDKEMERRKGTPIPASRAL